MNWHPLNRIEQIEEIKKESHIHPVLILKHSTTCSISATALGRLERKWQQAEVGDLKPYYLDLLSYRPISAQIAETFGVEHESPQILLIHHGESVYEASHFDIAFDEIKAQLAVV
jgi:bacillithiol system protein YtxJ